MKKTTIYLMALCMIVFSACTNQQKENNGPLPVADFEKEWETGDVSDDWSDFYVWAIWENADNPTIKFN